MTATRSANTSSGVNLAAEGPINCPNRPHPTFVLRDQSAQAQGRIADESRLRSGHRSTARRLPSSSQRSTIRRRRDLGRRTWTSRTRNGRGPRVVEPVPTFATSDVRPSGTAPGLGVASLRPTNSSEPVLIVAVTQLLPACEMFSHRHLMAVARIGLLEPASDLVC